MNEHHAPIYEDHAAQVTQEELDILIEHEPSKEFRILSEQEADLSVGRQSRVSVLEYQQNGEPHQVLWKRMGADKNLTDAEATTFNERLRPYRQSLIEYGWAIPKLFYSRVSKLSNESQIFSYEQYIPGGDGEKLLANPEEPNFRKWFLIGEVVSKLYQYPEESLKTIEIAKEQLTFLPHGLDLKLANIVLEADTEQLYFVDLFGTKELDEEGKWLTYNQKLDTLSPESLVGVCATREGALLRCWRLAEDHWHNGYRSVEGLRKEFLSELAKTSIPDNELVFIHDQITHNYPWLDRVYQEYKV